MMLVLGLDPGLATTGYGLVRETASGDLALVEYGTITTPAGVHLGFSTSESGMFSADLIPGVYGIAVTAYGYKPHVSSGIVVSYGASIEYNVDLERLPYGRVEGQLLDIGTGSPLSGTLRISGAPVTATVASNGRFALELPVGEYELVAWVWGHRLAREVVNVAADADID